MIDRFHRCVLALAMACASGHVVAQAASAPLASGIDRSGMDAGVRPQDDLFGAMNGGWLKTTEIPPDKSDYGTFTKMEDLSDERQHAIVEALAAKPQAPGSVEAKVADFYTAFMDTAAIEKAGLDPMKPWMAQVDAVADRHGLALLMGRWQGITSLPLDLQAPVDAKDPTVYSPQAAQGGLGLPDRDYYLKGGERFAKARAAYLAYMQAMLAQVGDKAAARHAAEVMALEKRIAQVQWDNVANRDPVRTYNPMPLAQVAAKAPGLDWQALVEGGEMPVPHFLSLAQPSYATGVAKLVAGVPLDTWKNYLRVRVLYNFGTDLPQAIRDARFRFSGAALEGMKEDRPRWKRAVAKLDGALGEAVGQVYVAKYFPPADKARMLELVHNLLATYRTSIDGLAWMTPPTKAAAQDKLAKYGVKIGYPDKWRDYSAVEIKAGDPVGNDARAARFDYLRHAVRVGKPVDRTEWDMTPQTVNAYYEPSKNEIVFPAAILQPPFFDMAADDAANYGGIGAVIGHEISHGFDDEGSQFDGDGKLRNWWTPADRKAFEAITSRLVAQYSAYEAIKGAHVNGKQTLGENIADLSGLQIAYRAWKLSLGGKPAPVIDGLTGDQRFFYGFAQVWREKMRDELALEIVTSNPHAPGRFRADGAAINSDAFHEAFGTKPGDRMWKAPAERLRLW